MFETRKPDMSCQNLEGMSKGQYCGKRHCERHIHIYIYLCIYIYIYIHTQQWQQCQCLFLFKNCPIRSFMSQTDPLSSSFDISASAVFLFRLSVCYCYNLFSCLWFSFFFLSPLLSFSFFLSSFLQCGPAHLSRDHSHHAVAVPRWTKRWIWFPAVQELCVSRLFQHLTWSVIWRSPVCLIWFFCYFNLPLRKHRF